MHVKGNVNVWKNKYGHQIGIVFSISVPLVIKRTASDTKRRRVKASIWFLSEIYSSNLKAIVLFMNVLVSFSKAKRKTKIKTFRTVAGCLFKAWQWVMTRRDDETFCYPAGFIALCTGTQTDSSWSRPLFPALQKLHHRKSALLHKYASEVMTNVDQSL